MSGGGLRVRAALTTRAGPAGERARLRRLLVQPAVCLLGVVGCLAYVHVAQLSESERRALGVARLLVLLRQHLLISLIATLVTCVVAVPLGIIVTRGPLRRATGPIITAVGFGQAAPAIGLMALGAVIFGAGGVGAVAALTVYGALPIVVNTVVGLDGVDPAVREAARGMGMSWSVTLARVELPLALPVIIAGIRTAVVLIVGAAALMSFTGGGGLGELITTGIKLQQTVTVVVGAILVAVLALLVDWLARLVEVAAT